MFFPFISPPHRWLHVSQPRQRPLGPLVEPWPKLVWRVDVGITQTSLSFVSASVQGGPPVFLFRKVDTSLYGCTSSSLAIYEVQKQKIKKWYTPEN